MIDPGGKWWRGDAAADVLEYLAACTADGYRADELRLASCDCGADVFAVDVDGDEGVARRTCAGCSRVAFLGDSASYWSDASPEGLVCVECAGHHFHVGVGFSLHAGRTGVRWVYLGVRCVACGVLASPADWKVGDGDLAVLAAPWSTAG